MKVFIENKKDKEWMLTDKEKAMKSGYDPVEKKYYVVKGHIKKVRLAHAKDGVVTKLEPSNISMLEEEYQRGNEDNI